MQIKGQIKHENGLQRFAARRLRLLVARRRAAQWRRGTAAASLSSY